MFNISETEKKWKDFWEKEEVYSTNTKSLKVFSIDTPPPTVSGEMHIGHAFSYAQQDFIARFRRMFHGNIFYPFGTDDNGLPTERLIEKINKVKSKEMSRKDFIDLCIKTLAKIKGDFIEDWKKLAISCDYKVYYSTINKHCQKISQSSFIELYKKSLVYRDEFPTLFCTNCQTPIAQAELEDKEKGTTFLTILFPLKKGKSIRVATTRPELLAACVAIFVHPKDKRYKDFVGEKVLIPLFGDEVEIIADNSADPEKGTGAMMICSYGDKFDVEAIKRRKLKTKVVLNQDGTLNKFAGKYQGMHIKQAREKVTRDLEKEKLIEKKQKIVHTVNVHDKCGAEIEFLSTKQWFIKILDKKKELIKQGKKIRWYPTFMRKRYENWIQGLEWDWSISRDRHFGIPIPLWYCKKCNSVVLASKEQLPVDPLKDNPKKKCKCGSNDFEPERNVIDTWATSALTPEIALALITKKPKDFIPMTFRPQAHDIIRTWAFYTIVKSLYHYNKIPWRDIVISGFVTLSGEKMSKSKGNIIDPQKIMDEYGADALRFWAASAKLGEDLEYQEKDLVTGKKTITKLWNASNFVSISLQKIKKPKAKLEAFDLWLLSKLNKKIEACTEYFKQYKYSRAKAEIENFFWKIFCDYYLEIIKNRVYKPKTKQEKESAQYTLYISLLTIIKLFAPIMPHITEELYQNYFKKYEKDRSIHLASWPRQEKGFVNEKIEKQGDKAIEIIGRIRKFKAKKQKSLKAEIILTLEKQKIKELRNFLQDLKAVTNAKEIKEGKFNIKIL
jgi:valyl-tRNA synthetase